MPRPRADENILVSPRQCPEHENSTYPRRLIMRLLFGTFHVDYPVVPDEVVHYPYGDAAVEKNP